MKKSVLITGAANGIGNAVARAMAKKGYDLALTDVDMSSLAVLKQKINHDSPVVKVETRELDVTDYDRVYAVVDELDRVMEGLDIVFANAGIFYDGRVGQGNFEKYKKTVEVNLLGTIATIDAAVVHFKQRGKGHLVVPASIAAYRALRGSGGYCATKAAISMFMETVRTELLRTDIDVTVLFPGYIDTDLNKSVKSRPFLISLEKGADIIVKLIEKKVRRATVPVFPWNIVKYILKILPTRVMAKI